MLYFICCKKGWVNKVLSAVDKNIEKCKKCRQTSRIMLLYFHVKTV